jgi:uncharacterized iron-regulated membrane protein
MQQHVGARDLTDRPIPPGPDGAGSTAGQHPGPARPGSADRVARQARRAARRRRNRRPVKKAMIRTHRWLSLILGLVLLLITTSGAAVVYAPEWTRWTNSSAFAAHHTDTPISFAQAIKNVEAAHPGFVGASVNVYGGTYEVFAADEDTFPGFYTVDPSDGRILGHLDSERGVMAFMEQLHECFFTCDDYPGYVPFLNKQVPTLGMHWLTDTTWAGVMLGVFGLLLLFLAISGIWLWWPGIKRMSHGFRVRMNKGRYARDYDLHQVIGMAAIPFLLVWGLTGASFEMHWVKTAWYAVTGGDQDTYWDFDFTSAEVTDKSRPDIGLDAAVAAAQAKAGPAARLVYASLPAADDPTAAYNFYFSRDFDQYAHGAYPGQYGVDVDRHNANRLHVNDLGEAPTVSNKIMDTWGAATLHYGQSVNGWWRLFWFVFGLAPLVLAVTGVSTWLAKRSVNKRKRAAARARAEVAAGEPPKDGDADSALAVAGAPPGGASEASPAGDGPVGAGSE